MFHGAFDLLQLTNDNNVDLSRIKRTKQETTTPHYWTITVPKTMTIIGAYPKTTVISNSPIETYFEGTDQN